MAAQLKLIQEGKEKDSMDRQKALEAALAQIDRAFGKGSAMKLGSREAMQIEAISTTSNGGTGTINLTGNEFGQRILGNGGANLLNGGGGNDALQGLGGADVYLFNSALNAATATVAPGRTQAPAGPARPATERPRPMP